jgi:restriction endonuclease S subunit
MVTESFRFVTVVDGATPTSAPVPGVCAVVTAAELVAASWSLAPNDYKLELANAPHAGRYPLVCISDLCTLSPGTSFSKASIVNGEFPVVGGGMKPMGMHNAHNTAANVLIISATGAGAGSVSKYNTPTYCTADALRLTLPNTVDVEFMHRYLSIAAAEKMSQMRTGMAQPHFDKRAFAELTIPLPPVETQRAIAAELDRLNASIAEFERHADTLRAAIKPSLMRLLYIDAPTLENNAAVDYHAIDNNVDAPDVDAPDDAAELLDTSE